jgi:dUTP pyrophosphatase
VILQYKKLRTNAQTPRRAHASDAGLDLAPTEHCNLEPSRTVKLGTGIAMAIPKGHVGLLVPRSSAKARGLDIVGIIDPQYRGELTLCVTNIGTQWQEIAREEFLAQLLIIPCVTPSLELCTELDETERGAGGFGSSDK